MNKDKKKVPHIGVITTISKPFIEESMNKYPILKKDKYLRRLYCYLSNQSLKHESIPVSARLLALIENKYNQWKNKNYCSYDLLERFNEEVFPLTFKQFKKKDGGSSDYLYSQGKSREVIFNNSLISLIQKGDKKVFIDSLKPFTRDKVSYYLRNKYGDKPQELDIKPTSDIEKLQLNLIQHLNSIPKRGFTSRVDINKEKAYSLLNEITQPAVYSYTESLLDSLLVNPQPIYKPSEKNLTTRIFTSNSYLNLPKNIREVFLSDCIKVDIKSSQFNIISRLWNIQSIIDFLDNGGNLWDTLFEYMGMTNFDPHTHDLLKSCFKRFTYSAIYGMGKRKLTSTFRSEVKSILPNFELPFFKSTKKGPQRESLGVYLSKHPFFVELFNKRSSILSSIRRNKGIDSPKGWLSLSDHDSPQSLLACMAQQVEMLAMQPIYDLLSSQRSIASNRKSSNKQVKISCLGWLHDGVYLYISNPKSNTHMWVHRLQAISDSLYFSMGLQYDISIPYPYSHSSSSPRTSLRSNGSFRKYQSPLSKYPLSSI